jgi:hypothetical protein
VEKTALLVGLSRDEDQVLREICRDLDMTVSDLLALAVRSRMRLWESDPSQVKRDLMLVKLSTP